VLRPGVALQFDFAPGNAQGQNHGCRSLPNGKVPFQARHIPVELVVILEVAKLAVRLVLDLISVLTPIQDPILFSNEETDSPGTVLQVKRLPLTVARHPIDAKRHGYACKERAAVEGWEIAIDTSLDYLPLGLNLDRLRDQHRPVLADQDAAVEVENLLPGLRAETGTQPRKPQGKGR
jgi:hypothetical protein